MIQLPEDLLRMQELVFRVQPDVIVETGVAHGGSLIFYATLCKALGRGRVVGVDIEIRPRNRAAIEEHALFPHITLIEGDSADEDIVARVRECIGDGDRVIVFLDSNHTREHVLRELRAYAPLVTPGSYIVAMDGYIMELVAGGPRTGADWSTNNAKAAAEAFAREDSRFVIEDPPFLFNEALIQEPVSYGRGGTLRRVR